MMLRKRAWDIMRDEFPSVQEDASMAECVRVLRDAIRENPDNFVVVVKTKGGKLAGAVSIWKALRALKESVLRDENIRNVDNIDWDQAVRHACLTCTQMRIEEFIEPDVPTVKPNDAALVLHDVMARARKSWCIVTEGGKVMGVVFLSDLYREMTRDMLRVC
ncbi:CBS domain-containing protein [Desulfovibrio oxyclinae]|jgi:CBS domain-containing protein|uniref:CBS domain-containing protein n=1 Tax=Desulfovibrio oxyclinae TaxID=63560 RepID=UPI000377D41E|nr:CBS domain-containing protein [Desulfovibrio oxyclinae]